jgi:AraC-like DNA-binding protein
MTPELASMQIWNSPPILRMVTLSPIFRTRQLRRHNHHFYEVGFVLGGTCSWHLGSRRKIELQAGDAILLPPKTMHCEEVETGGEARLAWLGFEVGGPAPAWVNRAIALGEDAPEIGALVDAIAREHHLTDTRAQTRIGLALQSMLLLLDRCAEGSRRKAMAKSGLNPRQTHTVESAAHYFRNNLRDPLSIAQVASYHSLCPAHFSSLFHRHHRITPRGFLRRARVQQAADLLVESDLTLKEIAAPCGFVDAAHLCKSFKEERRMTPGSFRAQRRKAAEDAHAIRPITGSVGPVRAK